MWSKAVRVLKVSFFVFATFIVLLLLMNLFIEEGTKLSTISFDGYKDLSEEDSIYIIFQDTRVKWGAVLIPDDFKRKSSLQVTFPGLFSEGMRRFTITAEDDDLIVSSIETRPLNLDPYPVKKYNVPFESDPDLRPLLPPRTGSGVNPGSN